MDFERESLSHHGTPPKHAIDALSLDSPSPFGRMSVDTTYDSDDEQATVQRETAAVTIYRLRELGHATGKGKESDRRDEAWDCLTRLTDLFKKAPTLYRRLEITEIIQATLPFLSDTSTIRRRTAAYRLFRYCLDRRTWGCMIHAGVEAVIIR